MNLVTRSASALILTSLLFSLNAGRAPAQTTPQLKAVKQTLTVDGAARQYFVYRPASVPAAAHPALVIVMHGYSGSAVQVESNYHWDEEADKGGFVVVYPDGTERSWNSGNCCATAQINHVDDVKFLTLLVAQLESDQNIDAHRVYFSGMSNGALMSYRMACDASFPIAAIGVVGGTLDTTCPSPQKTSLITINGGADRMIPYEGGAKAPPSATAAVQAWRVNLPSIQSVVGKWLALDDCGKPSTTTVPPVNTEVATCADGRAVEGIVVAGAGHQWPGGTPPSPAAQARIDELAKQGIFVDPPSTALSATDTIWQFFSTKVSK